MSIVMGKPKFTADDAQRAFESWGANCGPGALAAVTGLTLDEVRPHLTGFDQKHYTNPSMMFAALRSLDLKWEPRMTSRWPRFGLARVQWHGPWTQPGVPVRAAYRHTHWVAAECIQRKLRASGSLAPPEPDISIFDINCINVGGWVPLSVWSEQVVPWLLKQCEPKADGQWHLTHAIEIYLGQRAKVAS
jgi:hypothetical protein